MNKLIVTTDGMVFYSVTKESEKIMRNHLFTLFKVYHDGNEWQSKAILNEAELIQAKINDYSQHVCICLGTLDASMILPCLPDGRWNNAASVVHDGFVYVKANDLLFCGNNLEK